MTQQVTVPEEGADMRLDRFLQSASPVFTFSAVQVLCRKGKIRLDGKKVKGNERLEVGQVITVPEGFNKPPAKKTKPKILKLSAKDVDLIEQNILHRDKKIVVFNKPSGLPSQAGTGHSKSADRLLPLYFENEELKLTHRLDKDTSGVLIFARDRATAATLAKAFAQRKVEKVYWALVHGELPVKEGEIRLPIIKKRDQKFEKVEVDEEEGQRAVTHYRVLASIQKYHLVEIYPKTGRMHQIRAHFAAIGAPLVGDIKYGGPLLEIEDLSRHRRQLYLHARRISVPNDGKYLHKTEFEAPLPPHFVNFMKYFSLNEKELA